MEEKEKTPPKKDPVIKDPEEHKRTEAAFEKAEEDIEKDPDMDLGDHPDLDEGELARKEGHP
jgi:hypothetical protein